MKPKYFIPALCSISLLGCNFPNDPNNSLKNIQQTQSIKIGYCFKPTARNLEQKWMLQLAKQLNAKITWTMDNQESLYRLLEKNELDIVACDIEKSSPWANKLAFTYPYTKDHVFALPPGENAWLKYVNELIYKNKDSI